MLELKTMSYIRQNKSLHFHKIYQLVRKHCNNNLYEVRISLNNSHQNSFDFRYKEILKSKLKEEFGLHLYKLK